MDFLMAHANTYFKSVSLHSPQKSNIAAMSPSMVGNTTREQNTTITQNTTLEQDASTLLLVAKSLGKDEDWLRIGHDDNVSQWWGVVVRHKRITEVRWGRDMLRGTIPPEIGALSALKELHLFSNNMIGGTLPRELGNLSCLHTLFLDSNEISGSIPSSLANLTNLHTLSLHRNNFAEDDDIRIPPSVILNNKGIVQSFLYTTFRRPTIRYVITCIVVTNRRILSNEIHPKFTFLAENEDIASIVMSFLGDEELGEYRGAKLANFNPTFFPNTSLEE